MTKVISCLFSFFVITSFLPGIFIFKSVSLFQTLLIPIIPITAIVILKKSILKGITINRADIALYILLILGLINSFWSINRQVALNEILKFAIALIVYILAQIFIIILYKFIDLQKIVTKINKIILIMGLILSISVIFDGFNIINFSHFVGWQAQYRSVGFLGRPNFGVAILNICLAFINPFLSVKSLKKILMFAVAILIFCLAIMLTGSRMGILMLIINIIFIIFTLKKSIPNLTKKTIAFILICLIGIGATLLILNYGKKLYITQSINHLVRFKKGEDVNIRRFEILELSKQLLRSDPKIWIFGIGLANFEEYTTIYIGAPRPTHNLYLELLIGLGIGGLFIFIFFQWSLFNFLRKITQSNNFLNDLIVHPYLIALLLIWLEYFFLTDLRVNKIVWVVFGIICALHKILTQSTKNKFKIKLKNNEK